MQHNALLKKIEETMETVHWKRKRKVTKVFTERRKKGEWRERVFTGTKKRDCTV